MAGEGNRRRLSWKERSNVAWPKRQRRQADGAQEVACVSTPSLAFTAGVHSMRPTERHRARVTAFASYCCCWIAPSGLVLRLLLQGGMGGETCGVPWKP